MSDNPFMLWLDLETTGTNENTDQIIEVGCVLEDRATHAVVSTYQQWFATDVPVGSIDPVVLKMHVDNGLWKDIYDDRDAMLAVDGQKSILGWLGTHQAFRGVLPLAGSGVSHFDRRFIRRYWPSLDRKLAYAMFDVGVVRRFLREWGLGLLPPEYAETRAPTIGHRALSDAEDHRQEAIKLRDWLGKTNTLG